ISFVAATDGSPNADYGDVNGFGRVSAFDSWIISTIPDPSTCTLLAGAGLVMLFVGRFRQVNKQSNKCCAARDAGPAGPATATGSLGNAERVLWRRKLRN